MCGCASHHLGISCGGLGCRCHDDLSNTIVPILFDGFVIGKAVISTDGRTILATIDRSGVGLEIREVLQSGLCEGLAINPRYTPAKKKELWEQKNLPFWMG